MQEVNEVYTNGYYLHRSIRLGVWSKPKMGGIAVNKLKLIVPCKFYFCYVNSVCNIVLPASVNV